MCWSKRASALCTRFRSPLGLLLVWLLGLGAGMGCREETSPHAAASAPAENALHLLDLSDQPVEPFPASNTRATVYLFLSVDCPISNRYAPDLRRLHARFASQGTAFRLVYPGTNTTVAEIQKHMRDFNLPGAAFRDPQLSMTRRAQVRVTPEAAVFLTGGRLVYHGRIDDRFAALGVERPAPTQKDLEQALSELLDGKTISHPHQAAVGCRIGGLP